MDLKSYFSQHKQAGILTTADALGKVDVAVYARPHIKDDQTIAFIMRDRLSHQNLEPISKLILQRDRAISLWARPEVKRARRRTEVRRDPFLPTTQPHGLCSRSQPKGVFKWVLESNPHAAYITLEEGLGHQGKRLYLSRVGEGTDPERIGALRRRSTPDKHPDENRFLVSFHVDKVLPAVGTEYEA